MVAKDTTGEIQQMDKTSKMSNVKLVMVFDCRGRIVLIPDGFFYKSYDSKGKIHNERVSYSKSLLFNHNGLQCNICMSSIVSKYIGKKGISTDIASLRNKEGHLTLMLEEDGNPVHVTKMYDDTKRGGDTGDEDTHMCEVHCEIIDRECDAVHIKWTSHVPVLTGTEKIDKMGALFDRMVYRCTVV